MTKHKPLRKARTPKARPATADERILRKFRTYTEEDVVNAVEVQ